MNKIYTFQLKTIFLLFIFSMMGIHVNAQVEVGPVSCYPQFATGSEMDAAAVANHASSAFGTWKGALDYATANGITTINFAPGHYPIAGERPDWGDADGGFVIPAGMTVNGNGAVIDNAPVGTSQLCFATLSSNTTVDGFVFSQLSGNPNGGALFVPSSADFWTISNTEFFNCNQGTDALSVNMGAGLTGDIVGCSFYGNSNPNAVYPQSPGLPSSSALAITGDLTSDLNITNSSFSCNFRNVSGGAIQIHDDVHVDFEGCVFYRNEANASVGGAVSIRDGADVTFNNTNFIENFATAASSADVGAVSIESGSTVDITNCIFSGNESPDDTGALVVSGSSLSSISTLTISNTIFEGNISNDEAGAVEINNYSETVIDNCLFIANTAGDKGGALYVRGTSYKDLDIINSTFVNNNAGSGEGTIHVDYLDTDTDVYIDNCVICDNNSAEDIESEYITALTTVNDSYWDNDKGTINFTGTNTNPYTPSYDLNWNETSGAGWTGTYGTATGSGSCPAVPATNCDNQGSIGGMVWNDGAVPNGDSGDATDMPVAGVTVNLLDALGNIIATVTTNANGEYFFGGLENGETYMIQIVPPPALPYPTLQDESGAGTTGDSDINSSFTSGPITICGTCGNNGSVDGTDASSGNTHYGNVDAGLSEINVLPVELISFNGKLNNCEIELTWTTASEINNHFFEVQRSIDGRNFETLDKVFGVGNSEIIQNYNFTDRSVTNIATVYYRLKQVDYDLTTDYSNVITISNKDCGDAVGISNVYPNPFDHNITIDITSSNTFDSGKIELRNIMGTLISSMDVQLGQGQNIIIIPTSNVTPGAYYIKVIGVGREIITRKVMKAK